MSQNKIIAKLGDLVVAEPALKRLLAQPMPMRLAYHSAKLYKLVTAETQIWEERRVAVIKQHGVTLPDNTIELPPHKMEEFGKQMSEAALVPVEIGWGPISAEELASVPGVHITAQDLLDLGPLLAGDLKGEDGKEIRLYDKPATKDVTPKARRAPKNDDSN